MTGRGGMSGRGTARGGLHAIRATVEHVFGSPDLSGRTVLVQGVGAVGAVLARELAEAGARVLVSDVDESRAAATGFETVPPGRALDFEIDVFAPCAVGGTLNAESIPLLICRAVAGGEQPLLVPEDADRLHEHGIATRRTTSSTPEASSSSSASTKSAGTPTTRGAARGIGDLADALRRGRHRRHHSRRGR